MQNGTIAMSVHLSIKNASDEVVAALKLRAKKHHRSLQGELMAIIEEAAANWMDQSRAQGLRETATTWRGQQQAGASQHAASAQAIELATALMREGSSLGGRRFTRDEMHER
jgi:antitoxin FitA